MSERCCPPFHIELILIGTGKKSVCYKRIISMCCYMRIDVFNFRTNKIELNIIFGQFFMTYYRMFPPK